MRILEPSSLWNALKRLIPFRSPKGRDPRLPSLVRAIEQLASPAVMRQILDVGTDRRQWGLLAAAWIGVGEEEFMRAVANVLKLEYIDRIPELDVSLLGQKPKETLTILQRHGATLSASGEGEIQIVTVDPAQIRAIPYFDGTQRIVIGSWSEISRVIERAQQKLTQEEQLFHEAEGRKRQILCEKVLEVLMAEARAHGASHVDVMSNEDRGWYQFFTPNGKKGHGNIHPGILPELVGFLAQTEGQSYHSGKRGEVSVRSLGSARNFRIVWVQVEVGVTSQRCDVSHALPNPSIEIRESVEPQVSNVANNQERFPQANPLQSDRRAETEHNKSIVVLVVDDNVMFCRVLEKLLSRENVTPYFANNGAEAWEKLTASHTFLPNVIVSDLHMPVMNGKELLEKLRAEPRFASIPMVMLTSDDDVDAEVSLIGGGADAFISKTKDPRVLCAQIKRLARFYPDRKAA